MEDFDIIKMDDWNDLVMWDNISVYYHANGKMTDSDIKETKKILNYFLNNRMYSGYINKNRINMNPSINFSNLEIEYNISAYPNPLPKTFPEVMFNTLPKYIDIGSIKLVKKDYLAV